MKNSCRMGMRQLPLCRIVVRGDDPLCGLFALDLSRNRLDFHSVFCEFHTLNSIDMLNNAILMPDKWMLLIFLAQESRASLREEFSYGS